jgi:protease I
MSIFSEENRNLGQLSGKRVAILATDGFEQSELLEPMKALKEAGAKVDVVSLKGGEIRGWDQKNWGKNVNVDVTVSAADANHYDALMLPGGVMSPDALRKDEKAISFVKSFAQSGKPIAAICHGPWTLVEADVLKGKTVTSWPSLKTDLKNAGATWIDQEVVEDRNIITSRKPDDIPAFNRTMIANFARKN